MEWTSTTITAGTPPSATYPQSSTLGSATIKWKPTTHRASGPNEGGGPRDRSADGALVEAIEALVRAVLAPEARQTALDAELLGQSIRAYVRNHLADPTLDPEKLAAEHHVSLRFVQKMFAKEGGSPADYIRGRRLIHSRALLLAGETVGTSAFASGFRDVDTFTRAFKREFGHAPSALHGRAAAPGHRSDATERGRGPRRRPVTHASAHAAKSPPSSLRFRRCSTPSGSNRSRSASTRSPVAPGKARPKVASSGRLSKLR